MDGAGDMRRCHFVDQVIGNIYEAGFERALKDSPCPNRTCGCHIGYVHLDHLQLYPLYGDGVLERIPVNRTWLESPSHVASRTIAADNANQ